MGDVEGLEGLEGCRRGLKGGEREAPGVLAGQMYCLGK
jgi:hypothetical protein